MELHFKKDIAFLISIISSSIIVVYFTPTILTIYFISLLILFYNSNPRKDYIWVLYILVLIDNPGQLFLFQTENIISIGGFSFSFLILFILVSFIKIKTKPHYDSISSKLFFSNNAKPYLFWLCFMLLEGLAFGIGGGGKSGMRFLYFYTLTFLIFPIFYILPFLLNNVKSLILFAKILFILLIINLILQIINISTQYSLHSFLGGSLLNNYDDPSNFTGDANMIRPVYFAFGTLFSLVLSTVFIFHKSIKINKSFLTLIIVFSNISIILTATRMWMIAFFTFTIIIIVTSFRKLSTTTIIQLSIIGIGIAIFFSISSIFSKQVSDSFKRFSTIELIMAGDVTAGGTNSRLTTRLEPVKDKFLEMPINGWGFSQTAFENTDGHVGIYSLLMTSGIIGTTICLF